MDNGLRLPSVFTYGQAIEWIANAIGHFMSHEHLVREMRHLDINYHGVEPAIKLIIRRLGDAAIDDLSPREKPTLHPADAVGLARDRLDDALRGGRVTMTGRPIWESIPLVREIPKLQCRQIRFLEDSAGVATAVVASNPSFFWDTIRFDSAEVEKEWPVSTLPSAPPKGAMPINRDRRAVVGRPVGTTKEAEDMPQILAVEELLSGGSVSSIAAAVRQAIPGATDADHKRVARSIAKRRREEKGE